MMGNLKKTPIGLGMVLTILVIAFALLNIIPVNLVDAARDCRIDAVDPSIGPCTPGDETCIRTYCSDINFLKMQGFFDNKLIDENKEDQDEANKGDINNPEPDCLGSRRKCSSSSSSSYY